MAEKFHPVGIVLRKDWSYKVTPFVIAVIAGPNQLSETCYYIPGPISRIMSSTWNEYRYFIDDEGDISREPTDGETPQFRNP